MKKTRNAVRSEYARIANRVVSEDFQGRAVPETRSAVSYLCSMLNRISETPDSLPSRVSLRNYGSMYALAVTSYEDKRKRCAILLSIANGAIEADDIFEIVVDSDIFTAEEITQVTALSCMISAPERLKEWAYSTATSAMYDYCCACLTLLEIRRSSMSTMKDINAHTQPVALLLALLLFLALSEVANNSLRYRLEKAPPMGMSVILTCLIVSATLAPRAPQHLPASDSTYLKAVVVRGFYRA